MDIIRIFSGGFPLTKERLEFLQTTYSKAFSQFSKVIGEGIIILEGVRKDDEVTPTTLSSGVFLLNGEVIEFRGGAFNDRIAVFEEVVEVPYNEDVNLDGELDLKVSDVVRYCQAQVSGGEGEFSLSTAKRIGDLVSNLNKVGDFKASLASQGSNWLLCDGSEVLISEAPELYALVGNSYGIAQQDYFRLPNLNDRVLIGAGGDNTLHGQGGEKTTVLTESQLPSHSHTGSTSSSGDHSHSMDSFYIRSDDNESGNTARAVWHNGGVKLTHTGTDPQTVNAGSHSHTITTNPIGSNQPHNNMMPFLAVNYYVFKGY